MEPRYEDRGEGTRANTMISRVWWASCERVLRGWLVLGFHHGVWGKYSFLCLLFSRICGVASGSRGIVVTASLAA